MVQDFKPSVAAPSGQSPLRRFRGNLAEYKAEQREFTNERGTRQAMNITFNFSDVEVLEATEPYPWPAATITVGYAPPATARGGTRWEALAKSIRSIFPSDENAIDKLVGQRQEWAQLPATMRMPQMEDDGVTVKVDGNGRQVWADGVGEAWQVVSVDGVGSAAGDDLDYLAGLADGKTEQGFYQTALTDPKVTSNTAIVTSITDRKILETLTMANKISRDSEGLLHKV